MSKQLRQYVEPEVHIRWGGGGGEGGRVTPPAYVNIPKSCS